MSEVLDNNFITIQGFMVNQLGLKGNDLLIYALIYGFSQDGQSMFFGSRNYIAKWFNISLPTVDKALDNLITLGLIEKHQEIINGVKFNRYRVNFTGSKETLRG